MHIAKTVKGYKKAIKSVNDFYNGYDPMYSWWTEQSIKKLDSALDVYQIAVVKRTDASSNQKADKSGIVGNPIGAAAIETSLQFNTNKEKRNFLLASKAYQLIQKIKMKSIDKKILLQQIEIQPDGFNMYQFIKNYNTQ